MPQSNYIAAALGIAFLVFITTRGSLPKYLEILTGAGGQVADAGTGKDISGDDGDKKDAGTDTPKDTNATDENPSLSLLDQILKNGSGVGGQADNILDAVDLFGGIAG